MYVIPAIDLLSGRAVRLRRGRYDDVTTYDHTPTSLAAEWRRHVSHLHVVDLEGARVGAPVQKAAIKDIVAAFGPGVQVGGGVRSRANAEEYLALGVHRVVLGTAAISEPELVAALARAFPERIVVAVDAEDGWVKTEGWEKKTSRRVLDVVRELGELPLGGILYTDIARDGMEVGPNVDATARLAMSTTIPVIASGGVGTLEHLRALRRAPGPIRAAIVGRALHERRFTLSEAVHSLRKVTSEAIGTDSV